MSLIFQKLTASSGASSSPLGKVSEVGQQGQGVLLGMFGEALNLQMGAEGSKKSMPADVSGNGLNPLLAWLRSTPAEGSELIAAGESALYIELDLLEGALQYTEVPHLEQLEQALEENSDLLQEVQAWLATAQLVIQRFQSMQQEQGSAGSASAAWTSTEESMVQLPALAAHKETIRFAVQDVLTQLSQLKVKPEAAEEFSSQLRNLLKGYEEMLHAAVRGKFTKQEFSEVSIKANASTALPLMEEQSEFSELLPEPEVLTAGQLAIRSGGSTPIKTTEPIPVHQFAREMTQFTVNKLEFIKQQGFTEARISLNPEHLGKVDIKIMMQNGQLVAQFMTHSAEARELLDQQMTQLRTALLGQGLQVEKLEVTQNSQTSTSQFHMQDGRQSGSGQQQPGRRSKEANTTTDDALLTAELTEEWNDWKAEAEQLSQLGREGGFQAKA
ncbi:flagellar hook-length control protein FliK [Paenibacillus sp. F411]|uniref:flagellar hook-length control protein FliK n=1 Tax=Paenibacillus sp. F411 TaxID=2820239 RepID=UPI001AAF6C50|nr:flagellar hook-length control protein FliK [Paenibacillus sp. F411]MBO2945753.1 flagellar hook-length control protein FliK [Paenibacillus sp. F411]